MDQGNHEADLNRISKYLLSFFEFAAGTRNTYFDKDEWLAFVGADGKWLYELYTSNSSNEIKLRLAVQKLFGMERIRRQAIYDAIAHDMQFAENTAGFQFESILLEKEEQNLIDNFFGYFYGCFGDSSFSFMGLSEQNYGREEFVKHFFRGVNKTLIRICPVCMQTVTDLSREGHVEHYFGKKRIPCLNLHPYNLYFVCPICNNGYKKKKNPLYRGEPEVRKIFLPYLDTVRDRTELEFWHGLETDQVKLSPADQSESYIDEKIEAFDELFQLEKRWSGLLEGWFTSLITEYRELGFSDIQEVETEMRRDLLRMKAAVRKNPERFVEMKYREWILSFALKEFYAEMKREEEESKVGGV